MWLVPPKVERPVPPLDTASALASVSAPVDENEEVAVPPKYARYALSCVDDAFANCCKPVQVFAFVRLRPMVRAVPPLYVPENVSVGSVAVRSARLEPSAMPEMVELARLVLVTEVEGNVSEPETTSAEVEAVPETASEVEVAPVAVIFWNAFVPLQVLESLSSVEDAKLQVEVAKV